MAKKVNVDHVTNAYRENKYDPNGSYTGVPMDKQSTPTQDVDDL